MSGGGVSIKVDPGKLYHPVRLTCKFKVDPELALKCQRLGAGLHRGTPIGKVSELWPTQTLKRRALTEAKAFVGHMKNQGYVAQQPESEMELYGPFREKLDMSKAAELVNFEEGNPLIPQGHWGSAAHQATSADSRGPRVLNRKELLDSQDWQHGVAYLIRGTFLATNWKQDEKTGTLIV